MPSKKSSKGKKKSGRKKVVVKLGPNGELLYTPEQRHAMLIDELNKWLRINCGQLIDYFQIYDRKGCGFVTKEEFCSSLETLKVPLTTEDSVMLMKYLCEKPTRSRIDYLEFAKGVKIPFPAKEDVSSDEIKLNVRDISNPPCPTCKLKFPPTERREIRPRYILLTLELLQFLKRDHMDTKHREVTLPCNFTEHTTTSLTIFGVKQLIQARFGHSLLNLEVFKEPDEDPLLDRWTMSEIGHKGGSVGDPEEVYLYYITPTSYTCPLLLTDHYFAKHRL